MNQDNVNPINPGNDDAPFTGPNPDKDDLVSTRPETDGEIDSQEYYDEGLAGAAELHQDTKNDSEDEDLPDGFHIE
jgi:hypothetical protein